MIVKKNTELMGRKHFLIRALENHNITQEQYDKEIEPLEKQISENLQAALLECKEELKNEIKQVKNIVSGDGDMKRSVAKIIINFLKDDFTNDELKGVFRQGYKIMRGK